jgi:hypothetical protein
LLDVLPIGGLVCPGTGIQDNLANEAKSSASPAWMLGGA